MFFACLFVFNFVTFKVTFILMTFLRVLFVRLLLFHNHRYSHDLSAKTLCVTFSPYSIKGDRGHLRGVEWAHCLFLFPLVLGKM